MRMYRKPVPNILALNEITLLPFLSMEAFVSAYEALIALLHLFPEAVNL